MLGLIGKKLGMTRVFSQDGAAISVTVIQTGPCRITQVKTEKKEGYNALQLGFGQRKEKNITRPIKGHLAKFPGYFPEAMREIRLNDVSSYEHGQDLTVEVFNVGEKVDVIGKTKGRGFAGVIKRHHYHGGDDTHGNTSHRVPGSVGSSADPSRTWRGHKLPGQYGNSGFTAKNLVVVKIDSERNYLYVRGAVPGPTNGMVLVSRKKA